MEATRSPFSRTSQSPAYLDIDGLKIRYQMAGVGEHLVLLHGWCGSMESMGLVFNDFATHYAVCALDFPGHGESALPPRAWDVSDYAGCVLKWMDALHLQRPHIMAHSFGGRVAIKLASAHPNRVGKLILVDSAGVRPRRSGRYYVRVMLAKIGKYLARHGGTWGAGIRELTYAVTASRDYRHAGPLRDTFVKIVNEDLTPMLPQITAPTLLIWGENDQEVPVSAARVMKNLLPHAELVIFKHAGHFSYLDQYGKFRLVVGKFLREP